MGDYWLNKILSEIFFLTEREKAEISDSVLSRNPNPGTIDCFVAILNFQQQQIKVIKGEEIPKVETKKEEIDENDF